MNKIAILGCGWLGLPLAKSLVLNGFFVKGSTTSEEKLNLLAENKIKPFLISLSEEKINGDIAEFLSEVQILIIDIPPKLRGNSTENFVEKVKNLIPYIEKSEVKKVLFVSSTSVYSDDNLEITEETIRNPNTESGRQLVETERLLQNNSNFKTTILRFGGLIGEDRHPVKYLAGKENLENPDAPVNLIHQDDCIGIIKEIIISEVWNETFNAVAPFHPTRKEYYTKKAENLNLPIPHFSSDESSSGKIISSDKMQKQLNYPFNIQLYS